MVFSKHTWSHMISGPKTWFNLNVNLPRTDWDRSHIWELDYGIILWRIIPSFVKSITQILKKQWNGPNRDDGFCYV